MDTNLIYVQHLYNQSTFGASQRQKLFDYYVGNESDMLRYLKKALLKTFDGLDIAEFQLDYINITKKIVNQLSVVYTLPAARSILTEQTVDNIKNYVIDNNLTDYYNGIIPTAINTVDKMANRYGKLFNTSITQVSFDKASQKIRYRVIGSELFDVITDNDDPYKLVQLSYDKYFYNDSTGKEEKWNVVWTNENHYRREVLEMGSSISQLNRGASGKFTTYGDPTPIGSNSEMINPYGVITFAVNRIEQQGDFWGTGQCDLVNGNEQINFFLTDLANGTIMQTWGQMVLTNSGYKGSVRLGVKHPIKLDNNDPAVNMTAEFINANPLIDQIRESIDWKIKLIAASKGLNPNSFLQEAKATSGYSKIIDSLEQMEIRRDDIEPCRQYEDDRFNITRAVNNYHFRTPNADGSKNNLMQEIPDDAYLQVDFAEISIEQTIDEKIKEQDYKLSKNLISILDIAREQNPDLTDDELEKTILENKSINERIMKAVAEVDTQKEVDAGFFV